MTTRTLSIALGLSLAAAACGDMLTEIPKSFTTQDGFFKTPSDVRSATFAAYQPLGTDDLWRWWLWLTVDLASDQVRMHPDEPNYQTYHPEFLRWDATTSSVTSPWNGLYNIVFRANVVLSRAAGVTFADPAERQQLLAEATFLRGYAYLLLAKLYDDVPSPFLPANHGNKEMIWVIPSSTVQGRSSMNLGCLILPRILGFGTGGGCEVIGQPTAWHYGSYLAGDYRKDVTYRTTGCSSDANIGCKTFTWPNVYKYRPTNGGVGGPPDTDFPLYRYAEALLIYAEAQNELGNSAAAVTYLNMVRARARKGTRAESRAEPPDYR